MADKGPTAPTGIPAVGATGDERMKGALAYVFSWVTGLIVLLIAGDNKFLRFHAMQSIEFGVVVTIVAILLDFFLCLGSVIGFVCWLYMLYGAYLVYTGKPFRIPYFANLAERDLTR